MENVAIRILFHDFVKVLYGILDEHEMTCKENPFQSNTSLTVLGLKCDALKALIPPEHTHYRGVILDIRQQAWDISSNNQPDIEALNLTVRSSNLLKLHGIYTVAELCNKSEIDLLRLPVMGKRNLTEIKDMLKLKGLRLSEHRE